MREQEPQEEIVILGTSAINGTLVVECSDKSEDEDVGKAQKVWESVQVSKVFTGLRTTIPFTARRFELHTVEEGYQQHS
jgi:hypothetical protein